MDAGRIMRTTVWEYGGITKPLKFLFLLITLFFIITPVSAEITKVFTQGDLAIYNKSYTIPTDGSTPYSLWTGAILLGIILILLSFTSGIYPNGEEGLVSILSWIPISYALYASFAVDVLQGFGVTSQCLGTSGEYVLMESHSVYHFDVVAICLFILLAFAIGNTYRIWVSQKNLQMIQTGEE